MTSDRNSNIELLRIILMIFILMHHFLVWGAFPCILDSSQPLDRDAVPAVYLNGFLYMAVNCFVLISGYFGIKFKFRKIFNFYLICTFYAFVSQLAGILVFGNEWTIKGLLYNSIFCISKTWLWFIKCYFALLCLAPIINPARESLCKKEYGIAIILMSILSLYFGYWRQSMYFDIDGYSIYHFLYLYLIGGYINRFTSSETVAKHRWLYGSSYILISLIWGALTIYSRTESNIKHWLPFAYNNPIIILSALILLLFFLTFNFQSKAVNYISTGAFAVYLATNNDYIRTGLYSWVCRYTNSNICYMALFAVLFSVSIMLFDRIRIAVLSPVLHLYDRYIGK